MVEVTQGAAAELMEWLCEYDKGCDCDHCNDLRTHTLPLVTKDLDRLYQRGMIEGARLAIEAAATVAPNKTPSGECETVGQWTRRTLREAIRALSPAKIVGEG